MPQKLASRGAAAWSQAIACSAPGSFMSGSFGTAPHSMVGITKLAPSFTPLGQRAVTVLVRV